MGWDLEELQARKKLQIVFTSPEVLEQEVRSPDSLLLETAAEIGAQRIFIDGIGLLSQSPQGGPAQAAMQGTPIANCCSRFIEALSREKLTALISHETGIIRRTAIDSGSRRFPGRYRDRPEPQDPRRARSSQPSKLSRAGARTTTPASIR